MTDADDLLDVVGYIGEGDHVSADRSKMDLPATNSVEVEIPERAPEAIARYNTEALFAEVVDVAAQQSDRYSRPEILQGDAAREVRVHESHLAVPDVEPDGGTA